jgi:hypothetical protein
VVIVLLVSYYDTYRWACGLINDIDKCLKRLNTVPNFSPNQGNITSFMLPIKSVLFQLDRRVYPQVDVDELCRVWSGHPDKEGHAREVGFSPRQIPSMDAKASRLSIEWPVINRSQ